MCESQTYNSIDMKEENEEDILDRRYPRDYSWKRALVYSSIGTIGMSMFLISISMLVSMCIGGCAPVVTSHSGYVIHMDSEIIAVEHERMDKRGYGIVRYYPFVQGFEIGDCYGCK